MQNNLNRFLSKNVQHQQQQHIKLDTFNNKVINNYEIVDYDTSAKKDLTALNRKFIYLKNCKTLLMKFSTEMSILKAYQQQPSYDANTFDIYSYNDGGFVYQEEVIPRNITAFYNISIINSNNSHNNKKIK